MTVHNFMSKAFSYQDLRRGDEGTMCPPPRGITRQKYPGADGVNDGRTAGYSDSEVVGGVLKAISPNLRLRNVLETMEGLTLDTLLRFYKPTLKEEMPPICPAN